jgi:hypothetical protein
VTCPAEYFFDDSRKKGPVILFDSEENRTLAHAVEL